MGNFVDNVFSIWESLEQSYLEKGNGLSKKDYLLKVCGATESGGNKLDLIKASIMKHYEGNEFKCDILTKIFDAISIHWEQVIKEPEIEDLDVYIASLVNKSVVVERADGAEFLSNLNPYKDKPIVRVDPVQLLKTNNFITDVFQIKDESVDMSFTNLSIDKGVIVVKGDIWKYSFLQEMDASNKFHLGAYTLLSNLEALKEDSFFLFVERSRFTYRSDKVNLVYGNIKIPLNYVERKKVSGVDYILCEHRNDYVSTPVYCIL